MNIYPAIDLRNGKCVRLFQGNFAQETIYHENPLSLAQSFIAKGAKWLHVIDLTGAKDPTQNQTALITDIINSNKIKVQVGGGIRTQSQIKHYIDHGAERVIVGTKAITHQQEVMSWFKYFGAEHLVLALDIKLNQNNLPMVAINAWQSESMFSFGEIVECYQSVGLTHVLCTNISRDGSLQGPDFALYESIVKSFPLLKIQASGGVQSLEDIKILSKQKVDGVVIGRALYEKKFSLEEALTC